MTVKRVSLKVSPEAALRVASAREPSFVRLVDEQPLVVLGGDRVPEVISPSIEPSPSSCFGPRGACLTARTGPLWVCDTGHHRLLGWRSLPATDRAPADWIIGQKDFASEGRNGKAAVGPATVNVPTGICVVENGLAVADAWNHRVLIWHNVPTSSNVPADVVIGQSDFLSGEANRGGDHPDADTMHWPYGVHYHDGKLYVGDTGNRRVLVWNEVPQSNGQKADLVLGQHDFSTRDENAGAAPSDMSMRWPHAVVFWRDKLCVSDAGNNRILIWEEAPTESGAPATIVLGQADAENVDFNQSLYWPRASSLNMPYGMTSNGDWLIVADTANSRILGWHINQLYTKGDASALFGQKDFHEKGDNRWQATAGDTICWPYGVQSVDDLVVMADSGNNRVSVWKLSV